MRQALIDAGAVLDERDREQARAEVPTEVTDIEGARGPAELKGSRRPWPVGSRTFFVVTGLVMAAIAAVLLVKARRVRAENETRTRPAETERVAKRVPDLKLALPAVPPRTPGVQPTVSAGGGGSGQGPQQAPSDAELVQQRRLSRGFGGSDGESGSGGAGQQLPQHGAGAATPGPGALALLSGTADAPKDQRGRGELEEKLEASERNASSAGILPDRDYLLTQGAMLDCVLETKVVSTVAGLTSCHLTRDIYSANGRVVLLDRGSKVVGRYQGGPQQGQARIFVLWTRVETPSGVVVQLESPGTGSLGEAGLGGAIDTHFWDRFGAAMLLTIIGDAADAGAARAAGPQNSVITFTNQAAAGKEVVARSMEPTINIPPTLYVNQGERVGIFVARDLDFRSVYGLERTARAER